MVVVDTSVFSLFLRRNRQLEDAYLTLFHDLFKKDQIVLFGSVYQELLSGIRHQKQFDRLADTLNGFDVILATWRLLPTIKKLLDFIISAATVVYKGSL